MIIYYKNFQMEPGRYLIGGASTYERYDINVGNGRPLGSGALGGITANTISGSCQVELNRLDSSITFRYGE